jgi:hypothetical protein
MWKKISKKSSEIFVDGKAIFRRKDVGNVAIVLLNALISNQTSLVAFKRREAGTNVSSFLVQVRHIHFDEVGFSHDDSLVIVFLFMKIVYRPELDYKLFFHMKWILCTPHLMIRDCIS